jgi:hypothetical protein
MRKLLRSLTVVCFTFALLGVVALWVYDLTRHLHPTPDHQRVGAMPLILIGLSYIAFQLSSARPSAQKTQGLLLGTAFVLWGSEQLLPAGPWVTLMDTLVITIFVVDLALILSGHLRRKDQEAP